MTIEVTAIEFRDTDDGKGTIETADKIARIYENAIAAGGAVLDGHVIRSRHRGVDTLFLVADIPEQDADR